MTTIDYRDHSPALPERMGAGPLGLLRSWLDHRREHRRRRQALAELSSLDERLLRDIGISHVDIRDALRGRRFSVWLQPVRRNDYE